MLQVRHEHDETYPASAPLDNGGCDTNGDCIFGAIVTDQLDDATSTLINIDATIQEPAGGPDGTSPPPIRCRP